MQKDLSLLKNCPVYIGECDTYDVDTVYNTVKSAFSALRFGEEEIRGKNVVLKVNLVLAKKPDYAATSHPSFVKAVARLIHEMGAARITLADSPGGPYNAAALANVYRVCEMAPLGTDYLKINDDFTWQNAHCGGEKLKNFHVITPVYNADVIIDLCKLKTHTLTRTTCATKNLFGTIPGIEKFEMHSTFPEIPDFSAMLVDLSSYYLREKTFIAVCDAILSMEGNGPSHGEAKKTDHILVSRSPYALDVVGEHFMKLDGETVHLDIAAERGYVSRSYSDIPLLGKTECPQYDFKPADGGKKKFLNNLPNFMGGRFAKIFESKPGINTKKCIGCGKCAESCPRHTIKIEKKHGKKLAVIDRSGCIKCYCCQELCPIGAVDTKQNFIIKLIH